MAKLSYTVALPVLLWIAQVSGHGAVTSYTIDGIDYVGYDGYNPSSSPPTIEWQWPSYDPILDPSGKNIMCNGGTSAKLSAPVKAGGTVIAKWKQWTHLPGSVAVYMYKCSGDFSACNGSGNGWFKIDEAGLLTGTMYDGTWGAGEVLNTGQWSTKIPATLAPGNYLIRHELIAVHQSNTPQFYPECAQLVVSGTGTASPTGGWLTSIPGYCSLKDADVTFDIYSNAAKTVTSWEPPGPPVWDGTNNPPPASAPAAPVSTPPANPVSSLPGNPVSTPANPVSTIAPPPAQNTPGAPLYGQCGGQGWNGPTTCASGHCVANGDYYSQCMP